MAGVLKLTLMLRTIIDGVLKFQTKGSSFLLLRWSKVLTKGMQDAFEIWCWNGPKTLALTQSLCMAFRSYLWKIIIIFPIQCLSSFSCWDFGLSISGRLKRKFKWQALVIFLPFIKWCIHFICRPSVSDGSGADGVGGRIYKWCEPMISTIQFR